MALVGCKECKAQISSQATACPKCGAKMPKKTSMLSWVAAGTFALAVVTCTMNSNEQANERDAVQAKIEAAKTPMTRAIEAQAKLDYKADLAFGIDAARRVKAALKNPASFEFVSARLYRDGALCMSYRATNSFNAVTTEQIAITRGFANGDWFKDCVKPGSTNFPEVGSAF